MDARRKQRLSYQTGLLTFSGLGGAFRPRHLNRSIRQPGAADDRQASSQHLALVPALVSDRLTGVEADRSRA